VPLDKWNIADNACDYIFAGSMDIDFEIPGTLGIIQNYDKWKTSREKVRHYPLISGSEFLAGEGIHPDLNFLSCTINDFTDPFIEKLKNGSDNFVVILKTGHDHGMAEHRSAISALINRGLETPVILERTYTGLGEEPIQLYASTDFGGLLIDGLGDGVFLSACTEVSDRFLNSTLFNILQATRTRISKTEYISCPSCGRTLFDLQETTAKIRSRTYHLKGVKIGIMGCIVNGPGEMADADYGYVGSGPGRINLYRGKEVVKRNVPAEHAVDELIGIIREDGQWIELTEN
jgi:(E)-4-hydroxy-3-methylbut-2-enyl-diphosphate synthase